MIEPTVLARTSTPFLNGLYSPFMSLKFSSFSMLKFNFPTFSATPCFSRKFFIGLVEIFQLETSLDAKILKELVIT